MHKDIKKIMREAERQGWRIVQGTKHIKAYPPDPSHGMVTISSTAGDRNAIKNILRDLRRRGFEWQEKK
ncbi:MAG: hypothetical protein M3454_18180 [Actinomycetota bacterium]|nr:hypothetical protein [Actinomycetota bacterium]